jgi:hypothetical protein
MLIAILMVNAAGILAIDPGKQHHKPQKNPPKPGAFPAKNKETLAMSPALPHGLQDLASYSRFRAWLQMQPRDFPYNNTFVATLRASVAGMTRLNATKSRWAWGPQRLEYHIESKQRRLSANARTLPLMQQRRLRT